MGTPSRRNHYYQFLSDGAGASTRASAPHGGTSATESEVPLTQSQSVPFQPPPPPPQEVTPRPFQHLSLDDLLSQPGRERLPILDPYREVEGSQWFGVDSKVGRTVSEIIKSYFSEPHANISQVSPDVFNTWLKMFAQRYNWTTVNKDAVLSEFQKKVQNRLRGTVSEWKKKWQKFGDAAKPIFIEQKIWEGLVRYWEDPYSVTISEKCSSSRKTIAPDGEPAALPHTAGQTPFAGVRLKMAAERGGVLPPMTAVFEQTHRKKNTGLFVSQRAEQIYKDVTDKVTERETQMSQLSPGGSSVQSGGLTTPDIDRIFEEVAPKKKGKVIGVGSIRNVPSASSFTSHRRDPNDDPIFLRAKIAKMEKAMEAERSQNDAIFEIMALGNPDIAALLQEKRRWREAEARTGDAGTSHGADEHLSEEQIESQRLANEAAQSARDLPNFDFEIDLDN